MLPQTLEIKKNPDLISMPVLIIAAALSTLGILIPLIL